MKILIVCAAGMSSSLIVEKMNKAARKRGLEISIDANAIDVFQDIVHKYDIVLLGPQVGYQKERCKKLAAQNNISLGIIDAIDYGMLNGSSILDYGLSLL
ncbi:PTS sugar transporter subunit IIB [Orenia marismortui]|uniref:PTS sugar transporter subunit IIB n=1 Tax=Orenia marismortui TaxID=46469 RepID=UPI000372CF62|nr:PTS sugar transporter subunit IIB [Orenia marismortui]